MLNSIPSFENSGDPDDKDFCHKHDESISIMNRVHTGK